MSKTRARRREEYFDDEDMPWKIIYRQRSVLLVSRYTKFKLNTHQLSEFFLSNDDIVNFYANCTSFRTTRSYVKVHSVILYDCAKFICIRTVEDMVYVPIHIAIKLLNLQKLLRNNVLIFINSQLGN